MTVLLTRLKPASEMCKEIEAMRAWHTLSVSQNTYPTCRPHPSPPAGSRQSHSGSQLPSRGVQGPRPPPAPTSSLVPAAREQSQSQAPLTHPRPCWYRGLASLISPMLQLCAHACSQQDHSSSFDLDNCLTFWVFGPVNDSGSLFFAGSTCNGTGR